MAQLSIRISPDIGFKGLLECARYAEDLGFESMWMPEGGAGRSSFALFSALAMVTKRIKFGTGIINIYTRSPLVMAGDAATADEVSEGRFMLGLGSSTPPIIGRTGIKFEKPLGRMEDYINIINKLYSEEKVFYKGKVLNADDLRIGSKPYRPHIPIFVSALNPKMLHLTGALADGVISNTQTVESMQQAITWLHEGARDAGRDPSKLAVAAYLYGCINDDMAVARQASRRQVGGYVVAPFYKNLFARQFPEEVAKANDQFFVRNEREKAVQDLPERMVDALTCSGPKDRVKGRIEEYVKAGCGMPVFAPIPVGNDRVANIKQQMAAVMS